MEKTEFKKAKEEEQKQEIKPKEKEVAIQVVQIPQTFELAFQTPEGIMDLHQYFAWLGNMVYEIKKTLVG